MAAMSIHALIAATVAIAVFWSAVIALMWILV